MDITRGINITSNLYNAHPRVRFSHIYLEIAAVCVLLGHDLCVRLILPYKIKVDTRKSLLAPISHKWFAHSKTRVL